MTVSKHPFFMHYFGVIFTTILIGLIVIAV
jgi:hypothetical protein